MSSASIPRRLLRRLLVLGLLVCVGQSTFAAQAKGVDNELPAEVARILAAYKMSVGNVSVFVQDTAKDTPLLQVNADVARNPASTIKLLTTFLALDELNPSYRWTSDIYIDKPLRDGRLDGDLYIKGYGDPYMVIERYWLLLDELRQKGLSDIAGDLVIDNTYFDIPKTDAGAFDGQGSRTYNVTPDAFMVNFQAVGFTFQPDPEGKRIAIGANPDLPNLSIVNRLRLSERGCGGYQNGIAVSLGGTGSERVTFSGNMGRRCEEYRTSRAVLQAPSYAYGLFRSLWQDLGANLDGELRIAPIPAGLEPFHSFKSLALGDIIRLVNKWSNNLMARHLLLTLGAERFGAPGTVDKGRRAAVELLGERGLQFPELNIDNGAGLSRETRISAASLGALLLAANKSLFQAEFESSLPLSGLDGTLRRRFREKQLVGQMHIKTGRLDDVYAMAGYVRSQSGREFAVVAIQNDTGAHRGPGEEAHSALLKWVFRQ